MYIVFTYICFTHRIGSFPALGYAPLSYPQEKRKCHDHGTLPTHPVRPIQKSIHTHGMLFRLCPPKSFHCGVPNRSNCWCPCSVGLNSKSPRVFTSVSELWDPRSTGHGSQQVGLAFLSECQAFRTVYCPQKPMDGSDHFQFLELCKEFDGSYQKESQTFFLIQL